MCDKRGCDEDSLHWLQSVHYYRSSITRDNIEMYKVRAVVLQNGLRSVREAVSVVVLSKTGHQNLTIVHLNPLLSLSSFPFTSLTQTFASKRAKHILPPILDRQIHITIMTQDLLPSLNSFPSIP